MSSVLEVSEPFVEVPNSGGFGSTCREPTVKELADAKALKAKIDAIRDRVEKLQNEEEELVKSCKHIVREDVAGWPYDARSCYACGGGLGLI
jgi:hypothetical protein